MATNNFDCNSLLFYLWWKGYCVGYLYSAWWDWRVIHLLLTYFLTATCIRQVDVIRSSRITNNASNVTKRSYIGSLSNQMIIIELIWTPPSWAFHLLFDWAVFSIATFWPRNWDRQSLISILYTLLLLVRCRQCNSPNVRDWLAHK